MKAEPVFTPEGGVVKKIITGILIGASTAGISLLVLEYGRVFSEESLKYLHSWEYFISIVLIAQFFLKLGIYPAKKDFFKANYKDITLILACLVLFLILISHRRHFIVPQIFIAGFVILRIPQISRWILHFRISPPASVAVTFLIIIALGTALLLLPVASVSGKSTEFLNALFTATSATCVTGLIVVDTGSYFSLFGQIVILVLIQIGGLGLMTFASFFALLSRDFGVRDRVILRDVVRYDNLSKIGYLLLSVLLLTFIFEAIGAVILYFQFLPEIKNKALSIYSAIFHSVSAFCNAGFSIYSNSFMGYRGNIGINLTMSFLIIFGGLGFVVIVDLLRILLSWIKKQKREHLSLHSKMVLLTTGILIGLGATLFYIGEMDAVLKGLSVKEKILISYFQSITARTAGFNTVKISNLTVFSSFLLIILMFIGASPGSTGGGIKTSTFATLLFTIKSMVQGKGQVEAFKRTIPRITVYQALCVVILALGWLSLSTLLLSFTEKENFIDILFEVFSAFGTVGLSRGLTPHLTKWGKIIIIITMIVGRIGPLTLALAIAGRRAVKLYEYPEEKIIIG